MPSIVTHHFFAKDVLNNLPNSIKNCILPSIKEYCIFAQSFDNFYYYYLLTPWKGSNIRTLGNIGQKEKTNLYFKNILYYIKNHNLENNSSVKAYLYGSLCHYILDKTCHPYIIYISGNPANNKKYRGNHEKMETMIDAIIYEKKTSKKLSKASLENKLLPKIVFSNELIETMNYVFEKTFGYKNIGKIYNKSIYQGNFILKYLVKDRTGIKKYFYKIIDLLNTNSSRKYANLVLNVGKINYNYMNYNHEKWYYPANIKISKTDSFMDLYEKALEECTNIIKLTNDYFNNKIELSTLLKIIGNNSYITGLDCNLNLQNINFKD